MISAEIEPFPGAATKAARELQRLGYRVYSVGETISIQGPKSLWSSIFSVQFEEQSRPAFAGVLDETETYQVARKSTLVIPLTIKEIIKDIEFIEPPEFFR